MESPEMVRRDFKCINNFCSGALRLLEDNLLIAVSTYSSHEGFQEHKYIIQVMERDGQ
jgi:hypothetical protein